MTLQLTAIAIFIAVFALATLRRVHLGIMMFAVACGVGVWLAGMPLSDVVGGFPVSIMVLKPLREILIEETSRETTFWIESARV